MGSHPQALVHLQLWAHLDVLLVASWQELSQHVCAFTKAFAQRPFKCVTPTLTGGCGREGGWERLEGVVISGLGERRRLRALSDWESGTLRRQVSRSSPAPFPVCRQYQESRAFSFCAAGRWAGGERVARDGSGLRGVWWRQIRQFNRVSPAVADAVVTAFPSPRLLQQVGPPAPPPGVEPGPQDLPCSSPRLP